MSVPGDLAMVVLRLLKPGKGASADPEKARARARRENAGFRFSMPKNRRAAYSLVPDCERPCLIVRPQEAKRTRARRSSASTAT